MYAKRGEHGYILILPSCCSFHCGYLSCSDPACGYSVMEVSADYTFDQYVVSNASSIRTAALIVSWNCNYKTIYHISSAMQLDNACDIVFILWRFALIYIPEPSVYPYSQQVIVILIARLILSLPGIELSLILLSAVRRWGLVLVFHTITITV